jgi:hypothetical protein
MLRRDAPWEEIHQVLKILSKEYQAEVIAAARELVGSGHP